METGGGTDEDAQMNQITVAMVAAGISVVVGFLCAPGRDDWRRLLAYARRRSR